MSDVIGMESMKLEQSFSGKYIFVGEVGTLIHDSIVSPVTGTQMAGVELHAHMLDGLLQKQMLTRLSDEYLSITIVLMTMISIILYLLIPTYLSPIFAIVSLIALI